MPFVPSEVQKIHILRPNQQLCCMRQAFQFPSKWIAIAGYLAFATLGLMAGMFYLERMMMADAVFQTFAIFKDNDLGIQVGRFGSAATKVFPWAAIQLELPLKVVLLLYSLSFVIYPFLLYWILVRWVKNERMGLVLVFFFTLLTAHTFYWIQSELLQGCALIIFFYGLLSQWQPLKLWHLAILLPLVVVIVFFHPLAFIPFFFLWAFFALRKESWKRWPYWSVLIFCLAVLLVKHFVIPPNYYDSGSIKLSENVFAQLGNIFQVRSTKNFLHFLVTDYYFFPPLFFWVLSFYIIRRDWLKLALVFLATIGFLILINGTFFWGADQYYVESFYQVLTIFVAVPLVFDIFPTINSQRRVLLLVIGILIIRLAHIGFTHRPYSERLHWTQRMLEKTKSYPGTKFMMDREDTPHHKLMLTWGSSYETLMLSALQSPDSTRTYIIVDPNVPSEQMLKENKAFLTPFGALQYDSFRDSPYFHFRDTSYYRVLSKEEILQD